MYSRKPCTFLKTAGFLHWIFLRKRLKLPKQTQRDVVCGSDVFLKGDALEGLAGIIAKVLLQKTLNAREKDFLTLLFKSSLHTVGE